MLKSARFLMILLLIVIVSFTIGTSFAPPDLINAAPAQGPGNRGSVEDTPIDQIIIKYQDGTTELSDMQKATRMRALSNRAGVEIRYFRPMSGQAHVVRLPEKMPVSEVEALA